MIFAKFEVSQSLSFLKAPSDFSHSHIYENILEEAFKKIPFFDKCQTMF